MDGAGQSPGEESGMIRRMQSNWAEEVILLQEDKEEELVEEEKQGSPETVAPLDLSGLASLFTAIESQMVSLEAAMTPSGRAGGGGELSGAFGRQAYESLGAMLRQVHDMSSAMADRVQKHFRAGKHPTTQHRPSCLVSNDAERAMEINHQALSEGDELPRDVVEHSVVLVSRVERACLAHRARYPPQELERRLSRQVSYPPVSPAGNATATTSAPASETASGSEALPVSGLGGAGSGSGREGGAVTSRISSNEGAPIPETRTLNDLVIETDTDRPECAHEQGGSELVVHSAAAAGGAGMETGSAVDNIGVGGGGQGFGLSRPGRKMDCFGSGLGAAQRGWREMGL